MPERDDALIDLLASDERVAVDPLVGEHAAEEEEALGVPPLVAVLSRASAPMRTALAPAGDCTSAGLMMSGSVDGEDAVGRHAAGGAAATRRIAAAAARRRARLALCSH